MLFRLHGFVRYAPQLAALAPEDQRRRLHAASHVIGGAATGAAAAGGDEDDPAAPDENADGLTEIGDEL